MENINDEDIRLCFEVPEDRRLQPPSVAYDPVADALSIYFYGPPEPAYSVPVDADPLVLFRIHLEESYVVGMEIEGFVRSYLPHHPEMLDLARLAGVPEPEIAEIESRVSAQQRTTAVVNLLREHFEGAFAYAG